MLILFNGICGSFNPKFPDIYISIYKRVKLMTIVEGDPKASFSIATTPNSRGGHYSVLWMLNFTLDTYLIISFHDFTVYYSVFLLLF